MPVYVYEVIETGERFEILQSMNEDRLETHPTHGKAVRRVFLPPTIGSKHTAGKEKSMLDNKNVEKAGFTKYERDKITGKYNKVAGKQGPSQLTP